MAKKKITDEAVPGAEPSTDVAVIEGESVPATIKPLTENDKLALAVFEQTESYLKVIATKAEEYGKLTIADTKDTAGYKAVTAAMGEMKSTRIALKKSADEFIVKPAQQWLDGIKSDFVKVYDALKSVEDGLRTKKDAIDTAKEEEKKAEEKRKQEAMQGRINELFVLGAVFDNGIYTFPYDDGLLINSLQVKDFSDKEYGEFVTDVKDAYAIEETRKENERLDNERIEQEKAAAALLITQQATANTEKEQQLNEKRYRLRVKELTLLGYEPQEGTNFYSHEILPSVTISAINESDDATWDELIYDLENFTPAEEPLVKEEEDEVIAGLWSGAKELYEDNAQEGGGSRAAFGSTVDPKLDNAIDEDQITEVDFDYSQILAFSTLSPYVEFPISKTMHMRIFPDELKEQSNVDGEPVANQGKIQQLNWLIIKRA